MATYAIGDVQGCYEELRRLLDRLAFDPAVDRLWLVGDLVNRGPHSLRTLRFVRDLGDTAVTVLGNHDLHLLALAYGNARHASGRSLERVLDAPDRDELMDWLRTRPVLHQDPELGFTLVHAGLPPQWDLAAALARAQELEETLAGPGCAAFLRAMYGNEPALWRDDLEGHDRLRFITNCLTRLRYCDPEGRLALAEKGPPGTQPPPLLPWFQVPGRATAEERILFGHWSTLGYREGDNVWALDSGCLWGGRLTALRIDLAVPRPAHHPCPAAREPG
ncbi:MAG: symmetrical bis(5'-nucleosyl)-tetraphosphatase [Chromatiales bacterium]|jgi:bis(5'-nucleosyl)-tetraphosphatase (symmetrical)